MKVKAGRARRGSPIANYRTGSNPARLEIAFPAKYLKITKTPTHHPKIKNHFKIRN